jgi:hypothetical protein
MHIAIRSFKGIAPKIEPRYLPDGAAQVAIDVEADGQSVRPLRGVSAAVATVTLPASSPGTVPTIYKAGQDYHGADKYWLTSWADVSICRNQIAGDTCEWTFFAEPNSPTQVTNRLGWEGLSGQLPPDNKRFRLGIAAPEHALTGWVDYVTPETTEAVLTIDSSDLAQFVTWNPYAEQPNGFHISFDKGVNWFYPTNVANLSGAKASINLMAADLARLDASLDLWVSIDGGIHRHTLHAASNSAADLVTALAAVVFGGRPLVDASVQAGVDVAVSSKVAGLPATLTLAWSELPAHGGGTVTRSGQGTALTATAVLAALQGTVAHAGNPAHTSTGSLYFTGTALTSGGVATGFTLSGKKFCQVVGGAAPGITTEAACLLQPGIWIAGEKSSLSVKWGDGYAEAKTAVGATEDKGSYESRVYVFTWIYQTEVDSTGCAWEWESAPSPPSEVANVFVDSTVHVRRQYCAFAGTPPDAPPQTAAACAAAGGTWSTISPNPNYKTTGLRLYRSVGGQYLLVAEGNVIDTEYADTKKAEALGEPCPSLTWSPPPARAIGAGTQYLNGIINLPNGMVAGFLGRDVYFAEPYRPFAWPENYIQTLDDPIVGLGRMDTTLAALTTGTPYFLQGSHPENMNVVKADLEQSCVSKRSIVSMGRSVFYASPDGLMMLTPSGSGVITEALFDREYWQALVPANIHAYGHDGKYVAFFGDVPITLANPNGGSYSVGGFVLDTTSKQFYLHRVSARAGYRDLHSDTLYLATVGSPTNIVKWGQGVPVAPGQAVWRSKMFSMPQGLGFTCGQVEAGPLTVARDGAARAAYPLTFRVYCDGRLFHTQTIVDQEHYSLITKLLLSRRAPFRLPPLAQPAGDFLGRDWEIELDVDSEIFNIALAQSMSEIASV